MTFQPGTTIGHYEIIGPLGAGGMGVVFEARDTRLDRIVAVKVLPPDFAEDADRRVRFEREARTISQLSHPNLCTLFDVGEHEGQPYLVMELIRGVTIQQRLTREPFRVTEVLELGAQLADALDAAHTERIIHRNVKPANIFVTDRGQAKLLDFGLAKLAPDRRQRTGTGPGGRGSDDALTAESDQVTRPGSAVGTIAYMSPEQARGEPLDARTDLFSLGTVLYEMATGQAAFTGPTTAVIFDGILNRAPVAPVQLNPELPPKLQEIISNTLEKDRDLRYQSAADLRADLKRAKRALDSGQASAVSVSHPAVAVTAPTPPAVPAPTTSPAALSAQAGTLPGTAAPATLAEATASAEPGAPPSQTTSSRKRLLTLILCLPFGFLGAHRFYAGKHRTATLQLLTLGGLMLWALVDALIILFGEFTDGDGRKITDWV
jgi:serine/threonine protein kinase